MKAINNDFYHSLGEDWYLATSHPIALLRAENRLRNPWIASHLAASSNVVDLGCGAGLLTNMLSALGHNVTGVDQSSSTLEVARKFDKSKKVHYLKADAMATPLPASTFDAVCAMDLLEHIEKPQNVIQEAARLLKPGGLFFFHTFNRTALSWLFVIKGVEWCVKNAPSNMHVYDLFIRPEELSKWCKMYGMQVQTMKGVGLRWSEWPTWKMVLTRVVPDDLEFQFHASLKMGYSGVATKKKSL